MSADNWAVCPACGAEAEAAKTAQHEAVANAYGHVPVEEFDRLRSEAAKPYEPNHTFREDYETYLDGTDVIVIYEGRCTVCGSGIKFRDSRPIEIKSAGRKKP